MYISTLLGMSAMQAFSKDSFFDMENKTSDKFDVTKSTPHPWTTIIPWTYLC